jgi:hypothetical protein
MKPLTNILFLLCELLSVACYAQSPKVVYSAAACQIGTSTKLTAMTVGQSFDLVLSVQDLRPSGTWSGMKLVNGLPTNGQWPLVRGVFSAYCDVRYDKALAKVTFADDSHPAWFVVCFTFAARYPNNHLAADAADRIDNVGAFASAACGNQSLTEVWRVRMTAKAAGSLVFYPDVSAVPHPQQNTLVYGNDSAIPPEPSYVAVEEIVTVPCAVTVSN